MVIVTEKFFGGDMDMKDPVGEYMQVYSVEPVIPNNICCGGVQRRLIRSSLKSYANNPAPDMLPAVSLIPLLQSGVMAPPACLLYRHRVVPAATGSCCDCGRYATQVRMTFSEAMTQTDFAGGAPAESMTDALEFKYSGSRSAGFALKSHDQLAALPFRKDFFGEALVVSQQPHVL